MENKQLVFSFLEFVHEQKGSGKFDDDSLDVAIQCLGDCFQVDINNDEHKKQYSVRNKHSLPQIFEAGLKALSASAPTATAESGDKWTRFLSFLRDRHNFFDGVTEGTPEYEAKLAIAKEKYVQKFGVQPESESKEKAPKSRDDLTTEQRTKAEELKQQGNKLLTEGNMEAAAAKYGEAIGVNPFEAIYFANRAAAYLNLKKYQLCVDDCKKCIDLDPKYAKAYYRLGQAYASLGDKAAAISAYESGLNVCTDASIRESINNNLKQLKPQSQPAQSNAGGFGGMDFASLLSNPAIAQMAQNMDFGALMNNPNLMSMLGGMMGGAGAGAGAGASASPATSPASSSSPNSALEGLLNKPEVAALRDDPDMAPIIADIEANGPQAAMKYLGNPRVMSKLQSLMGSLGLGGGMPF